MSELNFEAMGRCEHLRKEIGDCLSRRDIFALRLSTAARTSGSTFISNTINAINISKVEDALQQLKTYENNVRSFVG